MRLWTPWLRPAPVLPTEKMKAQLLGGKDMIIGELGCATPGIEYEQSHRGIAAAVIED
jgi:hypothetical protein